MNYKWNYEAPDPATAAAEEELARQVGIHPALGKLLFDRGIRTEAEARHFFRPQLTELHDPFMMDDMQVAVDRLNLAMGARSAYSCMATTMWTAVRLWRLCISFATILL